MAIICNAAFDAIVDALRYRFCHRYLHPLLIREAALSLCAL
jgi:hypothetical protein